MTCGIFSLDKQFTGLNKKIVMINNKLHEINKQINFTKKKIKKKNLIIDKQNSDILTKDKQIDDLYTILDTIKASKFFKLWQFYNKIKKRIIKVLKQ